MTVRIQRCSARRAAEQREALVELLRDAVVDGASVGFLPPLDLDEARTYWRGVEQALAAGHRELLLAESHDGLVGAVQLELATQPNGRHRAEVMTLFVHARARRQGIARALMRELEDVARGHGRTLLLLETLPGEAAEQLYRQLGYQPAGTVPGYARSAAGTLKAAVFLYRVLEPSPAPTAR